MLFVCLIHVGAWRCVRCIGLDVLIVLSSCRSARHFDSTLPRCVVCSFFAL